MLRLLTALCLAAVTALPARADDPQAPAKEKEPAAAVRATALAKAKAEKKAVFLAFGSPTCGWCKYLDKYHARPAVADTLGKHLVFAKVDVVENPGGEDVYKEYAPNGGGVPVWVILGPDGAVLADSFEDPKTKEKNVGFPYEPGERAHYEKALRAALPKLTDAEAATVLAELAAAGPKKGPKAGDK